MKIVVRNEDMSPKGKLHLYIQDDGDIVVRIVPDMDVGSIDSVEFCEPINGGGRSKHTHKALLDLFKAIEKDNEERSLDF